MQANPYCQTEPANFQIFPPILGLMLKNNDVLTIQNNAEKLVRDSRSNISNWSEEF